MREAKEPTYQWVVRDAQGRPVTDPEPRPWTARWLAVGLLGCSWQALLAQGYWVARA